MNYTRALLFVVAACVESGSGPQGKKIDPTYVQSHLLSTVPADIERFDLVFKEGVTYLGNKIDKTRVPPGQPFTITHYWKVDAAIGASWRMFSQLRGAANTADFMNLGATDMQLGHGPATWQPGEIIEDIQTVHLRPDWRSAEATLYVGLIEVGKHGTLDRMAIDGPRTRDNAIIARKLEIDLARAPAPRGSVYVQRAQGEIKIDGLATDPGWAGVQQAELVPAEGGTEPIGKATAKLTWDDDFLYAFVSVQDTDIVTPYKNQDDPLWKGDCVELFIDADGNRTGYVELQVNPHNATFDSWFETTRAKPGDEAWDSNMVTAVKLRGSPEPADSGDLGWDVEIAIPWAAVKGKSETMNVRTPPEVGDRWRLNLVRVDRKSGAKPTDVWASSWNRISMADFHALDRMLVAVFADRTGSIIPQAKDPNAPQGTGDGSATGMTGSGSAGGLPAPIAEAFTRRQTPGLELEVTPTEVRFSSFALDAPQIDALLRLAHARDPQIKLVIRVAKGTSNAKAVGLAGIAKSIGLTNQQILADPGTGSAEAGSATPGAGSATRPAAGSNAGSATPGAGSATRPGAGSATPGAGSATRPAAGSNAGSATTPGSSVRPRPTTGSAGSASP
jgi:hypothetical protein